MRSYYTHEIQFQNRKKRKAQVVSFNNEFNFDDNKQEFIEVLGYNQNFDDGQILENLSSFCNLLDPKQKEIFEYRINGYDQNKIAREIGYSQPQVSRILKKIKKKFIAYIY